MEILSFILIVAGLTLFETVSSVDNAIINAEVLSTMKEKAKKWFLTWGLLFAVFVIRGVLPWLIVWAVSPSLGPLGSLTATFSGDPKVTQAIESSVPILLIAGGTFMIFLFFYWLFLEPKIYGLRGERFFHSNGAWFFAIVSILLSAIVVRFFTISSIDKIQKYVYLKNGAMYSILVLGIIMLLESFGFNIPSWLSPIATAVIVGYFFLKSKKALI